MRGKKYSGDLYAKKYGSDDGFVKMGNVSELTTKQEVETKTLKSTGKHDFGQAIDAEVSPQPIEVGLKFNTFDKHALARALMGEAVDVNQNVQTLTDVAAVVANGWVKLSHENIDPKNFVVKNKTQAVVNAEHYELNTDIGMILFKDGSGVKAGEAFSYSGKTLAKTGYSIDASTLQAIELELYLDGKDRITGKNGMLVVPHVKLSSDGNIDWFSDDWWEAGLSGTVIKEQGKAAMTFKEFD